jgi:subtilisin family serine protease
MKRVFFVLIIISLALFKLLGPSSAGELDGLRALHQATSRGGSHVAETRAWKPALLQQAGRFKPGEVLVKFATGFGASWAANLAAKGLVIAGEIPSLDIKRLAVPLGQELMWVEELRDDPGLAFVEPNYLARVAETIPDDPHYTEQWGLLRIRAPEAWDLTTGDDLTIAVIDTGVDLDHPDLVGKLWTNAGEIPDNDLDDDGNGYVDDSHGWDFVNADAEPQDDHWHGTHVAGIAAADTDNGQGVAGVSWGARIMPLKVLDASGEGNYADVASAITYAADNGARILNLSLGGEDYSAALAEAVGYARERDCLLAAAAGNDNGAVLYPAANDGVLAVVATTRWDKRWYGSNYGPEVDVAAPGADIYSTTLHDAYSSASGTSTATPHVSGLAALIWSVQPDLTNDEVTQAITETVRDLGPPGWDEFYGWGRIDAYQAVSSVAFFRVYLPLFFPSDSPPIPARPEGESLSKEPWN